jgi:hypothetical protein
MARALLTETMLYGTHMLVGVNYKYSNSKMVTNVKLFGSIIMSHYKRSYKYLARKIQLKHIKRASILMIRLVEGHKNPLEVMRWKHFLNSHCGVWGLYDENS